MSEPVGSYRESVLELHSRSEPSQVGMLLLLPMPNRKIALVQVKMKLVTNKATTTKGLSKRVNIHVIHIRSRVVYLTPDRQGSLS